MQEALDRATKGFGLDRETALLLGQHAPTGELLRAASEVRARGKGKVVSFSKKVFIPLTTLCRDYCSYCTFRKDPGQPGAHFMSPEEVLALAEAARRAGCKEALFSLGDQPERIFPEAKEFLARRGFARMAGRHRCSCSTARPTTILSGRLATNGASCSRRF